MLVKHGLLIGEEYYDTRDGEIVIVKDATEDYVIYDWFGLQVEHRKPFLNTHRLQSSLYKDIKDFIKDTPYTEDQEWVLNQLKEILNRYTPHD